MRPDLAIGLVLLLIAALVAGCGSTAGTSSSSSTKRSFTAFTACLKRHGINGFGSGQPPGGGQFPTGEAASLVGLSAQRRPATEHLIEDAEAFPACSSLAPPSGQGAFGPPGGSSNGG